MEVIIAGSRHITDLSLVVDAVLESGFDITGVISGAARGVDRLGEQYAALNKIPLRSFPAQWSVHGIAAGHIRNKDMALEADALILVWDRKSRGSASMLKIAKKLGLRIHESII